MNEDDGRAARRLFKDGTHFERWVNTMLYYADSNERFYLMGECTDYWDSDFDIYHANLRHIQRSMSAVFRVAAHLRVQRDELEAFMFIMAPALSDISSGRRWGAVPNMPAVQQDKVWARLKEPETYAYVLRVLRGFTGFGTEVVQYVCNSADRGTISGYVADLAKQDDGPHFQIAYSESQVEYLCTRVPAVYAKALRRGYRSSMSADTVNLMYRKKVPVEYASACLGEGLEPEQVITAWKAGVPVEYAAVL